MKYILFSIGSLISIFIIDKQFDVSWSDVAYQLDAIYFLSLLIVLFMYFFGGKFLRKKK